MMITDFDPIIALSTAQGRGGIGIVRLSFSAALAEKVKDALFPNFRLEARHAHLLPIQDAADNVLDTVIVLFFPAPASYTGESVLEIQAHGGPVVLRMIINACLQKCRSIGLRLAEPGEFTKRAYLNGKLDLLQAESVIDLIEASNETAARAAQKSMSGRFSHEINDEAEKIKKLRVHVEATLDFPEEEIDPLGLSQVFTGISEVCKEIDDLIDRSDKGKILRDGVVVALVGSPNVGKSSLLNALAEDDVAIVTDIAGTTRDRIEHWIGIGGVPFCIVDTAGVRETDNPIEAAGIKRTLEAIGKADIVLHLTDASGAIAEDPSISNSILKYLPQGAHSLRVANKSDIAGIATIVDSDLRISAKTGQGIAELKRKLLDLVQMNDIDGALCIARERHIEHLRQCMEHLRIALTMQDVPGSLDLLAEELRLAHDALGAITGVTTADDLLGSIFSTFCIGK